MTITEKLATYIISTKYEDIPAEAVHMAKDVMLDGIGVILAGSTEPLGLGVIVKEYTKNLGGVPEATVISGGFKTSVVNAAFANGTMGHALDYDNTWYPLNHPTSPTLPAILALAEKMQTGGKDVITALVLAFEVQGRLRLAATNMPTGEKFHKPGTIGIMGAVTGAGKILGLSLEQMLMAYGIAGSRACSLAINTGTMTKSSHSGHAARMGVEAALMAKMGWTAYADVFDTDGFPRAFFDEFDMNKLVDGFGKPYRMVSPGVGFKKHPCNYFTHRPIDATLELVREHDIEASMVEVVTVDFPLFKYVDRPNPETGLDGKFSIQYTAAAALLDKSIGIDTFTNERRFASDMEEVLGKVKLVMHEDITKDFDKTYAVVTITLKDGRTFSKKKEKLSGLWGNPLSKEELYAKFDYCFKRVFKETSGEVIKELVKEKLENLDNINQIMDIIRN